LQVGNRVCRTEPAAEVTFWNRRKQAGEMTSNEKLARYPTRTEDQDPAVWKPEKQLEPSGGCLDKDLKSNTFLLEIATSPFDKTHLWRETT